MLAVIAANLGVSVATTLIVVYFVIGSQRPR